VPISPEFLFSEVSWIFFRPLLGVLSFWESKMAMAYQLDIIWYHMISW
jgi:hypothetical protein